MLRPILLVEDNEDDIFLMKQALKKAAVQNPLVVAEDGQQAIEGLQAMLSGSKQDSMPLFVLLDLKMPRVPGLEVIRWMRSEPLLRTLPIIVLTSSSANADVEAAYLLGANSYFAKPSNIQALTELVCLLSEYWLRRCLVPFSGEAQPK
jgi:CheY-like chemotaxis protein